MSREISADQNDMHRYDDMLDMPHHVSSYHHPMPLLDRAAQFKPFAALNGYEEAILETERRTVEKKELSQEQKEELGRILQIVQTQIHSRPEVMIRFYQADERKPGGNEQLKRIRVRDIDPISRTVISTDGLKIPMDDMEEIRIIQEDNGI